MFSHAQRTPRSTTLGALGGWRGEPSRLAFAAGGWELTGPGVPLAAHPHVAELARAGVTELRCAMCAEPGPSIVGVRRQAGGLSVMHWCDVESSCAPCQTFTLTHAGFLGWTLDCGVRVANALGTPFPVAPLVEHERSGDESAAAEGKTWTGCERTWTDGRVRVAGLAGNWAVPDRNDFSYGETLRGTIELPGALRVSLHGPAACTVEVDVATPDADTVLVRVRALVEAAVARAAWPPPLDR